MRASPRSFSGAGIHGCVHDSASTTPFLAPGSEYLSSRRIWRAGEARNSAITRGALQARIARHRVFRREALARHVRESTEIIPVGEFRAAGLECLVAAGGDGEAVSNLDLRRGSRQSESARPPARVKARTSQAAPAFAPEVQVRRDLCAGAAGRAGSVVIPFALAAS